MNQSSKTGKPSGASLTHVGPGGEAQMVDVSGKPVTRRTAVAEAWVRVSAEAMELIRRHGGAAKGDVLQTARIAGIQAAKRTSELIPMCHPVATDVVNVEATLTDTQVRLVVEAVASGRTGVEMEALTGASVAALTVYDMLKAVDKAVQIGPVRLLSKSGGKSGDWKREEFDHGTG